MKSRLPTANRTGDTGVDCEDGAKEVAWCRRSWQSTTSASVERAGRKEKRAKTRKGIEAVSEVKHRDRKGSKIKQVEKKNHSRSRTRK